MAGRIEELLEGPPLSSVLTSMPGAGVRTGARVLIEIGDRSTFRTASHFAAYAGLAPATSSSGPSNRGEQPSKRGNKQLERAFLHAAFAAQAPSGASTRRPLLASGRMDTLSDQMREDPRS
ncbi:IS110 family transposase [Streptomyces sp. NPDC059868]|uniref:IS110 family transposase n=1 Tax=Streptomyces sp. NPDC059868 TaxID=3346979 RepID=UPI00095D70D1|nr:hypothetical protein AMK31_31525 [Streptomyces sp. TSRI0107]